MCFVIVAVILHLPPGTAFLSWKMPLWQIHSQPKLSQIAEAVSSVFFLFFFFKGRERDDLIGHD